MADEPEDTVADETAVAQFPDRVGAPPRRIPLLLKVRVRNGVRAELMKKTRAEGTGNKKVPASLFVGDVDALMALVDDDLIEEAMADTVEVAAIGDGKILKFLIDNAESIKKIIALILAALGV